VTVLLEVLSDHPGAAVRRTEVMIKDQYRRITEHGRAVAALQAQHAASRRWWQLGKRLRQYQEVRELRARTPVADTQAEHRLAQQAAGVAAEDQMTIALQPLSDDWLLFRGYANRRGEVDHLLVGPGGIWAIEVKGRGVCVHVDGDQWHYEKFDRYGNLVGQGVLEDRGGRSWGRQVSEIAGDLQTFLMSRGVNVTVRTAVVVIHDRASLGAFRNSSITVVSIGTDYLFDCIRNEPMVLDANICTKVARLIRRDHVFHTERRVPRRPR
jgi:hypothetical protein